MKIIVKTKPGSKENRVEKVDEYNYVVCVKAPATGGKANAAIIKLLADYFNINQMFIEILSGSFSRIKVVRLNGLEKK